MKTLNIILTSLLLLSISVLTAQTKQTYTIGGTKYILGETYKITGKPKVERNSSARKEFLNNYGYEKVPEGYQVDHIVPLSKGGADQPYNMQLIPTKQHKAKTARERSSSTSFPEYSAPTTTYHSPSYKSTSSYNYNSTKTIYTGSRGGQYYYNSNGNKTYIRN
jgi:hypothetical protein